MVIFIQKKDGIPMLKDKDDIINFVKLTSDEKNIKFFKKLNQFYMENVDEEGFIPGCVQMLVQATIKKEILEQNLKDENDIKGVIDLIVKMVIDMFILEFQGKQKISENKIN